MIQQQVVDYQLYEEKWIQSQGLETTQKMNFQSDLIRS